MKAVSAVVVLLMMSTVVSTQPAAPSSKTTTMAPSILLISIDTLRRDHVSAYGYARPTTPSLDRLARQGVLFANAVSGSNWTLPAHMSLMTGLVASGHGVEDDLEGLSPAIRTLAQVLQKQRYRTGGFASHVYLGARYGFDRGFDTYEVEVDQPASEVTAKAIRWLEDKTASPFFLFLHYFDPHWPYTPPPEFARRFGVAPTTAGSTAALFRFHDPNIPVGDAEKHDILLAYDGEVAYTDSRIGLLLKWLDDHELVDRTIVAVVSDHGEEFWDHGAFGHGTHLHGEVTQVPLLFRYPPRIQARQRVRVLAQLADLPATLLSLAGLEPEPQFTRDSIDLFSAGATSANRKIVLETTRWGPRRFAVRSSRFKLMGAGMYQPVAFTTTGGTLTPMRLGAVVQPAQLFDLQADPHERHNLIGQADATSTQQKLVATLREHAVTHVAGLRLSCRSTVGTVSYEGTLTLDTPLANDAFALLPRPGAMVTQISAGRFRFRARPEADNESDLIFPLTRYAGKMSVHLLQDGRLVFDDTFKVPTPGETRQIAGTPTNGCAVVHPRRPSERQRTTVHLAPKDLQKLRSLGYVP